MKKSDTIDDIKEAFSIFDKDRSGTFRVNPKTPSLRFLIEIIQNLISFIK